VPVINGKCAVPFMNTSTENRILNNTIKPLRNHVVLFNSFFFSLKRVKTPQINMRGIKPQAKYPTPHLMRILEIKTPAKPMELSIRV
jgi:hypothetical protein